MMASDSTALPDRMGHFGQFGGRFVPETLMAALEELEGAYREALADPLFLAQLSDYQHHYVGRPSPLYFAERLTQRYGRGKIFLKREDLNHTGAHKINNALGQALLALRMGKRRIIAETGAGQHGVATATVCARFGLECVVYMGEEDIRRQALNVFRMNLLGAEVRAVSSGTKTLKDALNEALRDWVANVLETHYIIGTVAGPHPFPELVREFQSVIGLEAREQCLNQAGKLPDYVLACVGGGSNALGIFHPFRDDETVKLIGIEAAGEGTDTERHAATLTMGSIGVLHGNRTYILQDEDGQILPAHSISAGLDYPGVGPEHAYLKDTGRASYVSVTDEEALAAFQRLSRLEGIIPALESAHAIAYLETLMPFTSLEDVVVVNLSGRGDKDVMQVSEILKAGPHVQD